MHRKLRRVLSALPLELCATEATAGPVGQYPCGRLELLVIEVHRANPTGHCLCLFTSSELTCAPFRCVMDVTDGRSDWLLAPKLRRASYGHACLCARALPAPLIIDERSVKRAFSPPIQTARNSDRCCETLEGRIPLVDTRSLPERQVPTAVSPVRRSHSCRRRLQWLRRPPASSLRSWQRSFSCACCPSVW
jgi:hypothetical protein